MKTARDCVEKFWLLHFENYKKEKSSIRDYCCEHGLKPSSFCDWSKKLKEKFPEKFEHFGEKEISVLDHINIAVKDDQLMSSAFFEIKTDSPEEIAREVHVNKVTKTKFILRHKNYEFEFSTYPRAEWLQNLIRGIE